MINTDWDMPSGAEISSMFAEIGWTTDAKVAANLYVTTRTVQRWKAEDTPIPYATWQYLRLLRNEAPPPTMPVSKSTRKKRA